MATTEDVTGQVKKLLGERRYQDAVRLCRRALLSKPENVSLRLLLGVALLALRRYDDVRAEMNTLLRQSPREAAAYRLLGEAYLHAGQPNRAKEPLKQAISLAPQDKEAARLLDDANAQGDEAEMNTEVDRWFSDDESIDTIERDLKDVDRVVAPAASPERARRVTEKLSDSDWPDGADITAARAEPFRPPPEALPPPARKSSLPPRPSPLSPVKPSSPPKASASARPAPPPWASASPSLGGRPSPSSPPRSGAAPGPSTPPKLGVSSRPGPPSRPSAPPPPPAASLRAPAVPAHAAERLGKRASAPPRRSSAPPRPSKPSVPGTGNMFAGRTAQGLASPQMPSGMGLPDDGLRPSSAGRLSRPELPPVGLLGASSSDLPPTSTPSGSPFPSGSSAATSAFRPVFPASDYPDLRVEPAVWSGPPPDSDPPPFPSAAPRPSRTPDPGLLDAPEGVNPLWNMARSGARTDPPPATRAPAKGLSSAAPWRARAVRLALGFGLALVVFLGGALALKWHRSRAEDPAQDEARHALEQGRRSEVEAAVALLGAESTSAELRARHADVLAVAFFDYAMGTDAEIAQLIDGAVTRSSTDAGQADALRIADAYLRLSRGEVTRAAEATKGVSNSSSPELWLARARVLVEQGDLPNALESAAQASKLAPGAPRYAAYRIKLEGLVGDASRGEQLLGSILKADTYPSVVVARAIVKQRLGDAAGDAARDAARLGESASLREAATELELAWADVILAQDALARGDREHAVGFLRSAVQRKSARDALLWFSLAELALRAELPSEALPYLDRVPRPALSSPRGIALRTRIDLALGRLDHAAQVLAEAQGDSPALVLLRGDLAKRRGDHEGARAAYRRALTEPETRKDAALSLSEVALAADAPREVIEIFEALPKSEQSEPLVSMVVRAHLALGKRDAARKVLADALTTSPKSMALRRASAELLLADGRSKESVADAEALVALAPQDLQNQQLLLRASMEARLWEKAEAAAQAILAAQPDDPLARASLARVLLRRYDVEAAHPLLEGLEQSKVPVVRRARGELLVLTSGGAVAAEILAPLTKDSKDTELLATYGQALFEAESYGKAQKVFTRVVDLDGKNPEAHLGLANVAARSMSLAPVERLLAVADREGKARKLGPEFAARVAAGRGRLAYERGNLNAAQDSAKAALKLWPACGEAHHLMADVAMDRGGRPLQPLEDAAAAVLAPPEALAQLAIRLTGTRACEVAARYLAAAPDGFDAPRVRLLQKKCKASR
jgi:tetratricopeptide (TPR) repeat protein